MDRVESCAKCPSLRRCTYDECNGKFSMGSCPDGECHLIDVSFKALKGLPDFCKYKNLPPSRCPKLPRNKGLNTRRSC